MSDDEQFRQIYSVPKDEQVKFFEDLRGNYRKRLEFPHFTMILGEDKRAEAAVLRDLRFDVKTGKAGQSVAGIDAEPVSADNERMSLVDLNLNPV
jgi:hypothetical protein